MRRPARLRAVAQYPSVDPNNIDATNAKFWGAMSFSTPFEPGSTFKSLTAAALIDKGLATPTTQVLAPYEFKSGNGADLHDSDYHAPERLTLTGVLMLSSNTGMSILGSAMKDQQRYDYLKAFGIGSPTGINFPGQSDGILEPGQFVGRPDQVCNDVRSGCLRDADPDGECLSGAGERRGSGSAQPGGRL